MPRVDLAIGCSYKYVNGGPGSPAFLYVRDELQEQLGNPLSGWMGQKNSFDFLLDYEPAPGHAPLSDRHANDSVAGGRGSGRRFAAGGRNGALAGQIDRSVRIPDGAVAESYWPRWASGLNSPREAGRRGSHITLGHDEGWRIAQALIGEMKVLPAFPGAGQHPLRHCAAL